MMPRSYRVVVDDPDMRRRHEVTVEAFGDHGARHEGTAAAVARDWFDSGYDDDGVEVMCGIRVDDAEQALPALVEIVANLWAEAWPITAPDMRPSVLPALTWPPVAAAS